MADSTPELIVCGECGCLNERATALFAEADETISDLEKDLRGKRAMITSLQRERREALLANKRYRDARKVLEHWSATCAPNAKEIDSSERLAAVIARLNGGHTVDELKLCATGYAKVPYVTREGRSPTGTKKQWNADAELIYRSPEHVRRGIAYASSATDSLSTAVPLARLSWRRVWEENRKLILHALDEKYGPHEHEQHPNGYRLYPCPKCSGDDRMYLPMRVADEPGWTWLAECQRCGMNETRLIAAITEDKNE